MGRLVSFGAGFQRQGQRLIRHTHFLLDDWKPKTNWRARESHRIRPDHPRRFVGIRLEIPGRSLTNRIWKVCPHISQNLVQTTTSLHQAKRTILDVKADRSFHCHYCPPFSLESTDDAADDKSRHIFLNAAPLSEITTI